MRSVVAYCRTAWEPQRGPSAARGQARAIRRYAARRGLTLGSIYMDAAVSGITLKRPGLRRLLADCRAGRVGTVIMRDPARLSRDTGQLCALLCGFLKAGVRVEYSAREGQRDNRYLEALLSALAELNKATRRSK